MGTYWSHLKIIIFAKIKRLTLYQIIVLFNYIRYAIYYDNYWLDYLGVVYVTPTKDISIYYVRVL